MTGGQLPVHIVDLTTDRFASRLWRLRRRHDHLDASLHQAGAGWDLTFALNDRPLLTTSFKTRDEAVADAETRRRDLVRVGWALHW